MKQRSNESILKAAIEKAFINGYKPSKGEAYLVNHGEFSNPSYSVRDTIFSHKFAKSFWGEEIPSSQPGVKLYDDSWAWHLQQMVLEPDPLAYLAKYL